MSTAPPTGHARGRSSDPARHNSRIVSSAGSSLRKVAKLANDLGVASALEKSTSTENRLYPSMDYCLTGEKLTVPSDHYVLHLASWLCKVSYEKPERIREVIHDFVPNDPSAKVSIGSLEFLFGDTCFAYVLRVESSFYADKIFVVFRGLRLLEESTWNLVSDSAYSKSQLGQVHSGIWSALTEPVTDLQDGDQTGPNAEARRMRQAEALEAEGEGEEEHMSFYDHLVDLVEFVAIQSLQDLSCQVIVCGHSTGGAMAVVFATLLRHLHTSPEGIRLFHLDRVITLGSPRIGDSEFVSHIHEVTSRIVNGVDMIPHHPSWMEHCGSEIWVTTTWPLLRILHEMLTPRFSLTGWLDHLPGAYVDAMSHQWDIEQDRAWFPRIWELILWFVLTHIVLVFLVFWCLVGLNRCFPLPSRIFVGLIPVDLPRPAIDEEEDQQPQQPQQQDNDDDREPHHQFTLVRMLGYWISHLFCLSCCFWNLKEDWLFEAQMLHHYEEEELIDAEFLRIRREEADEERREIESADLLRIAREANRRRAREAQAAQAAQATQEEIEIEEEEGEGEMEDVAQSLDFGGGGGGGLRVGFSLLDDDDDSFDDDFGFDDDEPILFRF